MQFSVPHDHPSLPGHFPGRPLVPGVVVLERVLAAIDAAGHGAAGPLRLPQVKFLRPLLPGQVAEVALEQVAQGRWRFRVSHEGAAVASGEVAAGSA